MSESLIAIMLFITFIAGFSLGLCKGHEENKKNDRKDEFY